LAGDSHRNQVSAEVGLPVSPQFGHRVRRVASRFCVGIGFGVISGRARILDHVARSTGVSVSLGRSVPPSVDFASGDLTCGEQCPEQPWPWSRRRQGRLGLDAALELLVERPIAFLCARALPLAKEQPCKGKEPATYFLHAVGDDLAFEPPSAHEGSPALLDVRGRVA